MTRRSAVGSGRSGFLRLTLHRWRAVIRSWRRILPRLLRDAAFVAKPEGLASRGTIVCRSGIGLQRTAIVIADARADCRTRMIAASFSMVTFIVAPFIGLPLSACEQANDWDRASTTRLGQHGLTKDQRSRRVQDLRSRRSCTSQTDAFCG